MCDTAAGGRPAATCAGGAARDARRARCSQNQTAARAAPCSSPPEAKRAKLDAGAPDAMAVDDTGGADQAAAAAAPAPAKAAAPMCSREQMQQYYSAWGWRLARRGGAPRSAAACSVTSCSSLLACSVVLHAQSAEPAGSTPPRCRRPPLPVTADAQVADIRQRCARAGRQRLMQCSHQPQAA